MNSLEKRSFPDRVALDRALAVDVSTLLARAVAERGRASLVVSGGSTPVNFFRLLSQQALPWGKVVILLADERWVSPDDQASNERLVRENLLIDAARDATFIPFKTADEQPEHAEVFLDRQLSALGTFDLVILGMGSDGHTASLFPGAEELYTGLDLQSGKQCVAVTPPHAPYRRISMTLPRLLDSRQIILHITGYDKCQVLERALRENDPEKQPVAAIVNQQMTPVINYFTE